MADVCAFLASDDSRYITGSCVEVTGKDIIVFLLASLTREMRTKLEIFSLLIHELCDFLSLFVGPRFLKPTVCSLIHVD